MLRIIALLLASGIALAPHSLAQRPGGGPGGPNAPDRELVKDFDQDGDGRLNQEERNAARKLIQQASQGQRRRGPQREPGQPGEPLGPDQVDPIPNQGVYDLASLRTYFLEFEGDDWEAELADFKATDVLVPATLTVDGQVYPEVGVSFRGASSFFMIPAGLKRSLNLSLDFVHADQRLQGIKTLNLLNLNGDESMLSTVLYSTMARRHMAAPRANFAKVVINGRSWGIYCNVEQFNRDFVEREFGSAKGARWKVSGSPRGDGGLRYLGEDLEPYRERFEIKSKDRESDWKALIALCQALEETPTEKLDTALAPILDLDSALWFLALDVVSVNSDGYWTRASDYSLYRDPNGVFHILPHDMNEAFREGHGGPGGPGGRRGRPGGMGGMGGPPPFDGPPPSDPPRDSENTPSGDPESSGGDHSEARSMVLQNGSGPPDRARGGRAQERGQRGRRGGRGRFGGPRGGVDLDPLVGLDDSSKPLRSRLLANEALRTRYLHYVRILARDDLAWESVGPLVAQVRAMLATEVAKDTRKLGTLEGFLEATAPPAKESEADGTLYTFLSKRRRYLLEHEAIQALAEDDPKPLVQRFARKQDHPDLPKQESPLQITEIMATPQHNAAGDKRLSTDWMELYNSGDKAIDLSGLYLTDNPEKPHKWAFPTGVQIPAGQHLLIWADGKAEQTSPKAGLHASFKLSKKGEGIFLCSKDAVLAALIFPKQVRGESFGAIDGELMRLVPTPGAPNRRLPERR